jgi:3-phenylpropionate/trans-cinnamate dioxygenase ferredoxin subunit
MAQEILLCRADQIKEKELRRITAANTDFFVTRLNGAVCVLEDRCPHMNYPLSMGTVEGTKLTCPGHGAIFDLSTSRMEKEPTVPAANPQNPRSMMMAAIRVKGLTAFEVAVRGGNVYAKFP